MAKGQIAKYKVLGDGTGGGVQIAGAGAFTKDSSGIFPPGTILNVRTDFEPRACMWPLNEAAKKAFEARRKKVEKEWRESLARGEDPSGKPIANVEVPIQKDKIEQMVKAAVERVGPRKPSEQVAVRKDRPRLAPGSLLAQAPEAPKKRHPAEEELLEDIEQEDDFGDAPGKRASDME